MNRLLNLLASCTLLALFGCLAEPSDTETEAAEQELSVRDIGSLPEVSGEWAEPVPQKPKCNALCRWGGCFANCEKTSNLSYCVEYCDCVVYEGKSSAQCQIKNSYIDYK
jgi:hypothetical protein